MSVTYEVRARMSTVVHKAERTRGSVTAGCGTVLGLDPWHHDEARVWHSPLGGPGPRITECSDCFPSQLVNADSFVVPDPKPTVSIQHRCPNMRLHVTGFGEPGSHPGDLPVPCSDCYSLVVTSVAVRWQPPRPFTTVFGEDT